MGHREVSAATREKSPEKKEFFFVFFSGVLLYFFVYDVRTDMCLIIFFGQAGRTYGSLNVM